jgi:hypothetical protein
VVVNVVGLLYGGAMLVNFAWPRVQSNMTPTQSGVLDFHIGFLNKIPILWTVFVFIVVVGAIYYLLVGRNKEFAPIITPAEDDQPLAAASGQAG